MAQRSLHTVYIFMPAMSAPALAEVTALAMTFSLRMTPGRCVRFRRANACGPHGLARGGPQKRDGEASDQECHCCQRSVVIHEGDLLERHQPLAIHLSQQVFVAGCPHDLSAAVRFV